ncbi:PAS domain-containing sensor histidine kinase [Piscinibacter terrae]|uniref:histidine kinase n=1 Tax=Piscinibacter terrae TaxID=2496871 RepID=A0A3N7HNZ7_9BURK|nr:PAS domain-containing sensor histidine kinase [Albitalea terrae]RQP22836.1 PAS domain-containing sensor histidine kinase [Albitalea terrae]
MSTLGDDTCDGRFRLMADTVPVMIWAAGADKQFEWFNQTWLDFTGRTPSQERGSGWFGRVHPEDLERCVGIWHASFDARQAFSMDFRLQRADGSWRWMLMNGVPRYGSDGGLEGYTGSCVDIHERKDLEERLAERTRALRLADRRKDEFLAMLAHDLRNPLGPIANATAILKMMESQTPAITPVRQIVERQLEQLQRVIGDMRDVTRITQAKVELHHQTLDVARLVKEAAGHAQPQIDSRGHRLSIRLGDTPLAVSGDEQRLSQALAHLLCNAAKFTAMPGVIEVFTTLEGGRVNIHVRDHGHGIAPDFLPQVFEPFAQESHSTPRTNNGLGVGLTIARRLAQLHGGDITAFSGGRGEGAEFVLSLPLCDAGATPSHNHREPATSAL